MSVARFPGGPACPDRTRNDEERRETTGPPRPATALRRRGEMRKRPQAARRAPGARALRLGVILAVLAFVGAGCFFLVRQAGMKFSEVFLRTVID